MRQRIVDVVDGAFDNVAAVKLFSFLRKAQAPVPPKAAEAPPSNVLKSAVVQITSIAAADGDDSYEKHLPADTKVEGVMNRVMNRIAPIRTEERVLHEYAGSFFGVSVGITFSQLELVKKNDKGREFVHVVNADGSSNLELVLNRYPIGNGQRIEIQGPALNTSVTPGDLPLGARFIGVGLTGDVTSAMDHDAVSYTAEVKLTEKSVLELAAVVGPGAAVLAADALQGVAGATVAHIIGDILVGAVPFISGGLALASARRALFMLQDPTAPASMKTFQVLHAVGDAVRVFAPITGSLINGALVGVAALFGWVHARYTKHDEPAGPDVADDVAGGGPDDAAPPPR